MKKQPTGYGPHNSIKQQNFIRLDQNEKTCRKQNKCHFKIEFVIGRVENIVGKGENACYQPSCSVLLKVWIVW